MGFSPDAGGREDVHRSSGWRRLTVGTDTTGGPKVRQIFRRFWPFAAARKRWLVVAFLLALLGPAIDTLGIWLFKVVVDDMLIPRRFDLFWQIAGLFVVLTVLEGLVGGADEMLSTWLSQRFLVDLRVHVLRHLQGLSLDFFQRSRLGDLLSRMSSDIAAIESFLVSGSTDALTYLLRLFFFIGALFVLQWQLALVSLVVTPLFWLTARYFSNRIKAVSREKQRRSGSISSVMEQNLSNVALVQAYDKSEWEVNRFRSEVEGKYRAEMVSARLRAMFSPTVDLIEVAGVLTVMGFGAWLLSRGSLTVGGLLAFLTFLSQLYSPVRGLGGLVTTAYSASAGAERVIEVLDERPLVTDRPEARDIGRVAGRLEFHHVTFSYPGADRPTLRDVSFAVGPGEVLALVGDSGAGKSTLAKLMLRFYEPDEGIITLDGIDLRDISLSALRRNVAVLLQETLVIDGTIRDNIAYGRAEATDDEIVAAARAADADSFVTDLPEGYDTRIGERGQRLSGGQGQRVAIARAMLRDSPVLLLDEPTTGLDAGSAERIIDPLRRLLAGRASVVISHNLSAVREAGQILVLEAGRIVEQGTAEDLLRRGGRFADLWRLAGLGRPFGVGAAESDDRRDGTSDGPHLQAPAPTAEPAVGMAG